MVVASKMDDVAAATAEEEVSAPTSVPHLHRMDLLKFDGEPIFGVIASIRQHANEPGEKNFDVAEI